MGVAGGAATVGRVGKWWDEGEAVVVVEKEE